MTLCIIGKFDIPTMEGWIVERFSPVKNFDVVLPDLSEPKPYPTANINKFVQFVPVKDVDKMSFVFFLPYCQKDHKTQPLNYLS